jgi:hypothetical protein
VSVGFFIGVRESFTEDAQQAAEALLEAVNAELAHLGLPLYDEPRELPDVYDGALFGRSALDHDSARLIVDLATRATAATPSPQLERLIQNPYRVVFVPREFEVPVETGFEDRIGGEIYRIWCGSSPRLWRETLRSADVFGIPLTAGALKDETARHINEYEALGAGDGRAEELGDLRTTWLTLHEAARLSSTTGVALCLAG